MLYLTTPSSPKVREAMSAGVVGCMTTPAQGNIVPTGARYACDNGKFGKGWPGVEAWRTWLMATVARYGAAGCIMAVAPDVPMDSKATLSESLPHLPFVRSLGVPAAFVAQDGCEEQGMIPWADFDVLFIGGSTDWKLSKHAALVTAIAKAQGKAVHMGRVNSRKRLHYAASIGCDSADGTFIAFGPDVNLPKVESWLGELRAS